MTQTGRLGLLTLAIALASSLRPAVFSSSASRFRSSTNDARGAASRRFSSSSADTSRILAAGPREQHLPQDRRRHARRRHRLRVSPAAGLIHRAAAGTGRWAAWVKLPMLGGAANWGILPKRGLAAFATFSGTRWRPTRAISRGAKR